MNLHDKRVPAKAGKYVTRQKHEEARGKFCHRSPVRSAGNMQPYPENMLLEPRRGKMPRYHVSAGNVVRVPHLIGCQERKKLP